MTQVMITLTHVDDRTGRFVDYVGQTVLDIDRIESIEEIQHPEKGPVTYITMQSGQGHPVSETLEQVVALMVRAQQK